MYLAGLENPRPQAFRFKGQGQPDFTDLAGRGWPKALAHQITDMSSVVECGDTIIGLRPQRGTGDAASGLRVEQRQPTAFKQIVQKCGDENGFSGTGQAGDTQTHGRSCIVILQRFCLIAGGAGSLIQNIQKAQACYSCAGTLVWT